MHLPSGRCLTACTPSSCTQHISSAWLDWVLRLAPIPSSALGPGGQRQPFGPLFIVTAGCASELACSVVCPFGRLEPADMVMCLTVWIKHTVGVLLPLMDTEGADLVAALAHCQGWFPARDRCWPDDCLLAASTCQEQSAKDNQ
jgi:hypothetical protein